MTVSIRVPWLVDHMYSVWVIAGSAHSIMKSVLCRTPTASISITAAPPRTTLDSVHDAALPVLCDDAATSWSGRATAPIAKIISPVTAQSVRRDGLVTGVSVVSATQWE